MEDAIVVFQFWPTSAPSPLFFCPESGLAAHTATATHLCQGPGPPLHDKLCMAEFTVARVGGGEPLLQAALVYGPQRACAITGRQQTLSTSTLVADSTNGAIAIGKSQTTIG